MSKGAAGAGADEDEGGAAAADREAVSGRLASRGREGALAVAGTLRPHARILGALAEAGRAGDGSLCADLAISLCAVLRESAVLRAHSRKVLAG